MILFRRFVAAALTAALFQGAPVASALADNAVDYALTTPPSALEVGCQSPCACPIVSFPTFGSFQLTRTGSDPLSTHYTVDRYIASFNNGPGAVAITGSGEYTVGGEVALTQQLTLDLVIEGQPPQHFDSGVVPVTAPFPKIDIACAVHGFYCVDSVLIVSATPGNEVTGLSPPVRVRAGLEGASPNPFATRTRIGYFLDRPRGIDLTIVDLEGRRVRALASGLLAGPGSGSATWNGQRDDGRVAPAGVYWVRMRWSGGSDQLRFVKLTN